MEKKTSGNNRKRTLGQAVALFAIRVLFIPLVIFSVIMQIRVWSLIRQIREENMNQELKTVSLVLDMTLERYSSVLYDFCTNDDMVSLIEDLNDNPENIETARNQLWHRLDYLGTQLDGIEGITLLTADGALLFYDRSVSSFVLTSWTDTVSIPQVSQGVVYQSGDMTPYSGEAGEERHLIQICRRIVDYRDINRDIGTVVMSVDQDVIWEQVPVARTSQFYICQDDMIVAASDSDMIDTSVSEVKTRGNRVLSITDELTGWTIYNYFSLLGYNRELLLQFMIWILYLCVIVVFGYIMLRQFVQPLLSKVSETVLAMQKMEEGDFSVRVSPEDATVEELSLIAEGFNELAERLDEVIEESKRLVLEQKNAELSALEAQIDPHFLYNTLDTINWRAIGNNDFEVSRMLGDLSDIMQYSIRNPGGTITMREETEWLRHYIDLQKTRLSQELKVEIAVPEELMDCRIHKLLLQPFVENAIKHGLRAKESDSRLIIRARLSGSQLHIEITDNGVGIGPDKLESLNHPETPDNDHMGIANVRKRLNLYYGEDADIYFESEEGIGTTVHLFISAISGE